MSTLATGRTATLIKLGLAAGSKFTAAILAFVVTAMVTRILPVDESGLFLLGFTVLTILTVVFRLGMDNVIIRLLASCNADQYSQSKFNLALVWVALFSGVASLLLVFYAKQIAVGVFNKPEFESILSWFLLAAPAISIFFLISLAFQARHRILTSVMIQNIGLSSMFIVALFVFSILLDRVDSAKGFAFIYSVCALIMLPLSILAWFSMKDARFIINSFYDKEMAGAATSLWGASCMSLAMQWSGILVAGAMLESNDVALLATSQRTALLLGFVLMIVNMVVAPRYAQIWKSGNIAELNRLSVFATIASTVLVLPMITLIILVPDRIMSLFGSEFSEAANLLVIMASGQFINVVSGASAYLLNMTCHEKDYAKVTMISGPVAFILSILLTAYFGVIGAAIAIAIGGAVQNVGALVMVKVRLGFSPVWARREWFGL